MGLVALDALRKAEPAIELHFANLRRKDEKELAKTRERLKALLAADR